MKRLEKRYTVEEEDDEDSYKDLSSGEEDNQDSPEDLLASVTTVVKVDATKSPASKSGGSYAQMYKNSKKSRDEQPQQLKNPRICLVNDSLVSLSAIKKTNTSSFPQRYQADLTCSYSISESSLPEPEPINDEEDVDEVEEDEECEDHEYQQDEEADFGEEQDEADEEADEEDDQENDECTLESSIRTSIRGSQSDMNRNSIRTSLIMDIIPNDTHSNTVEEEDIESESQDIEEVQDASEYHDENNEEQQEEEKYESKVDEEIDEAVLPQTRVSVSRSMIKKSISDKAFLTELPSLSNTIKTEIDNEEISEDEAAEEYKDLEEISGSPTSIEQEEDTTSLDNSVNISTGRQEPVSLVSNSHHSKSQTEMKQNIMQSISLFKQYKASQVSQSIAGFDQPKKPPPQLKTNDQSLRVSKVLDLPKPNINLNESISDNDLERIKRQNHLLRMQLLEQHRLIDEGKLTLQEKINEEIEKAKSQALKDYLSMTKPKEEPVKFEKSERKTIKDYSSQKKSTKTSPQTESTDNTKVKESPRGTLSRVPSKKEVIEILPDDFENTTDMKKQKELRNKKFLEVRKQKIEKMMEENKQKKDSDSQKNAENGMILKNMKQPSKTNKLLIRNALIHLTLAGEVNKKERDEVFEEMKEYEETCQLILLVREVNVPAFRALYAVVNDVSNANVGSSTSTTDSNRTDNSTRSDGEKKLDQILVKKIIGKGPKFLTEDAIDVFCRYDSGGKKLAKLASRTFGVTTDVVVLKSAAVKKTIKR